MNEKTNGAVSWAVNRDVNNAVFWSTDRDVDRDLDDALDGVVYWNVSWSVNNAAYWIVHSAVYGALHTDPEHPALQEFLHPCGAEMETQ